MRTTVIVQDLNCDECKLTVVNLLQNFNSISKVKINLEESSLSFDYISHNAMEGLRIHLIKIGHPITKDHRVIK